MADTWHLLAAVGNHSQWCLIGSPYTQCSFANHNSHTLPHNCHAQHVHSVVRTPSSTSVGTSPQFSHIHSINSAYCRHSVACSASQMRRERVRSSLLIFGLVARSLFAYFGQVRIV
ncbi:hypothetical protein ACLKA6_003410 [Drosophila palustris]